MSRARTIEVSISERWEGYIEHLVQSGRYGSVSEVVGEGLRLSLIHI